MRYLVARGLRTAKQKGFSPVDATAEQLTAVWQAQAGSCAWTGDSIELADKHTHLEHDHATGEFRGFVSNYANLIEGNMRKISPAGRRRLILKLIEILDIRL